GAATSRRGVLRGGGALALGGIGHAASGAFVCAAAQAPSDPSGAPDAILSGGTILTMDDRRPTAEAVAVRGGRILAVGSRAEIGALRGAGTRMLDLGGGTLLPGFVDSHGHVMGVGLQALAANLLPAPDGEGNDIAAIQRLLRDWVGRNAAVIQRYGLIIGFGYDDSQLREQRHPTRDDLDAVSRDVPILVVHQSSHLCALNSRALEMASMTAATEDPAGGVIRRRPGGREPDGVLEETAFYAALGPLLGRLDATAAQEMVRAGCGAYARFGYTTGQAGRESATSMAAFQAAAGQGLLPIDVVAYPDIVAAAASIGGPLLGRTYRGRLRIGGAKLSLDGSPQGKTAWLTRPYHRPPAGRPADYAGYPALPADEAKRLIDLAFANNWQLLTHCSGDAALDLLIEGLRAATARHGSGDRRPVLIHGHVTREDQVEAMRELDVIPSFFPMHTFYWGDWHRDSVLGPERAANISPCQWALRRGMIFTTHHDAPVANPDSMRVLAATVTRVTRSGQVLGPDQRVPVDIALKAMTLWAARQHFEEDTKGSIEPGKLADFVLLGENPLTVAPERLAAIRIIETFKEGQSIHRA
uniref:amidohydrolase n=1 Tax=Falsiroseomonas oryziterrae TaxID=2911368 RepID=UPI001F3187E6